jgi:hypothetical protein
MTNLSNKKLRRPTTYGVRMSTVLNTDGENLPTTDFSRAITNRITEKIAKAIAAAQAST